MVYTDGIHLIADTLEELHRFAYLINLKRCWFHGVRKKHPHYDLCRYVKGKAIPCEIKKHSALTHGAKLITSRELIIQLTKNQSDQLQ